MSHWIFLRGLTRETRHWGDFPRIFAAKLAGSRVTAIDLPGNGEFNGIASLIDIDGMVEFCRNELKRRGLVPPYHLLALSLGGMVALAWAAAHPQELAACVLINSSLRRFSPFYRRLRPASYLPLARLLLSRAALRQERVVLQLTSSHAATDHRVLEHWAAWRSARPVSTANALRQLIAAARYRAPRLCPPVPVLLLAAAADRLVHPSCSVRMARAWGLSVVVHPTAGHDLPLDDPLWVAEKVEEWMQQPRGARRDERRGADVG